MTTDAEARERATWWANPRTKRCQTCTRMEARVAALEQHARTRRNRHYPGHDMRLGTCCTTCDNEEKARTRCGRCGTPFYEWTNRLCDDPELDAVLSARPTEETAVKNDN